LPATCVYHARIGETTRFSNCALAAPGKEAWLSALGTGRFASLHVGFPALHAALTHIGFAACYAALAEVSLASGITRRLSGRHSAFLSALHHGTRYCRATECSRSELPGIIAQGWVSTLPLR
jgi:hypothetical protein